MAVFFCDRYFAGVLSVYRDANWEALKYMHHPDSIGEHHLIERSYKMDTNIFKLRRNCYRLSKILIYNGPPTSRP